MLKRNQLRPGFVRVLIPSRNKTIQIRQARANDKNYMARHGLVLIPEPVAPIPVPPQPTRTATDLGMPNTPILDASDEAELPQAQPEKPKRTRTNQSNS